MGIPLHEIEQAHAEAKGLLLAEVARATGLDATVAQGMMTLAYASELLTRAHGRAWLERGEISVKFIGLVYAGDTITVRGRETEPGAWEVGAENQRGEPVMVGEARIRA